MLYAVQQETYPSVFLLQRIQPTIVTVTISWRYKLEKKFLLSRNGLMLKENQSGWADLLKNRSVMHYGHSTR